MDGELELYQYLYDLQGFLVIEDVLSTEQVTALNALIDAHVPPVPDNWNQIANDPKLGLYNLYRFGMAGGSYESGPGFLGYGQPFVDLVDHALVLKI
ncbi:MAG: hypothetical protein VYC36_09040, partial [Pseudomonadota bacterium]|nr:hypothetical protein [Pseudomonadota bacterium]